MAEVAMIPLEECQRGHLYEVFARNFHSAVFDGERGFIGIREKFGSVYLFTEYHWEADPHVGTARPVRDVGLVVPEDTPLTDRLPMLCIEHGREAHWVPNGPGPDGVWVRGGNWCHIDDGQPCATGNWRDNAALFEWLKQNGDYAELFEWLASRAPHDD